MQKVHTYCKSVVTVFHFLCNSTVKLCLITMNFSAVLLFIQLIKTRLLQMQFSICIQIFVSFPIQLYAHCALRVQQPLRTVVLSQLSIVGVKQIKLHKTKVKTHAHTPREWTTPLLTKMLCSIALLILTALLLQQPAKKR